MKLFLLLSVLCFSGCASVINGDTVPITVTAKEPGTTVRANGQTFEPPVVLQLPRGQGNQLLTFMKPGEPNQTVTLIEDASAWLYGNLPFLFVGILFIGIDAANPHGYTLNPDVVEFSFAPVVAKQKEQAEFGTY